MKKTKYIIDFPELIKEWDYEKNNELGLDPAKTSHGRTKHVYWKCEKGHSFFARIDHRTIRNSKCPYCAGKKPIIGENDFATLYPNLLIEWDYNDNENISPKEFLPKSNKKVSWICSKCNHKWKTSIANRTIGGTGCPKCAELDRAITRNQYMISNNGSFFDNQPDLLNEWDYEKNKISPNEITEKSNKKFHWVCPVCSFSYTMTAANKSNGQGCPACAGKKLHKGYNDLETLFPEIAAEWHPTKNGNLLPSQVLAGSSKKVWWLCKKGHEWDAAVYSRKRSDCPVCTNKVILSGYNDLKTTNPSLAAEWHPTKNGNLLPDKISSGSNKKVWWLCSCGYEWSAVVSSRVQGCGCPKCSNVSRTINRSASILKRSKSLEETHPEIAAEWHPTKNAPLLPSQITAGCKKRVWWLCKNGHEWDAVVYSRKHRGCPYCNYELNTSFPEQTIFYYLSKIVKAENRKKIDGKEIDIFLPDYNVGIEYNGRFYHKDRQEKDNEKIEFFQKRAVRIISVIEGDKDGVDGDIIYCTHPKNRLKSLKNVIKIIIDKLSLPYVDIDISRDEKEIKTRYLNLPKDNSVSNRFPQLLTDWDFSKNDVDPYVLPSNQYIRVYWKCSKCGFESFTAASNYAEKGCPCCKGRVFIDGYNNLPLARPEIMDFWDYERNKISPNKLTVYSQNMINWKCENGHLWRERVRDFTKDPRCPICSKGESL